MPKATITKGMTTCEFFIAAALIGPWAANYLGVDLQTLAILFGWLPTDAEQVKMLAEQIQGSKAGNSPIPPLVGLAYVIGRTWLKAHGISLDLLKTKSGQGEQQ